MTTPTLDQPIIISRWWKNRRGEEVRVTLRSYEGFNLIDVRSFYTDGDSGVMKPGKGFSATLRNLPQLADAIAKALAEAERRGLLNEGAPPVGQRKQHDQREEWMG
jgi:hypothetical protein